ncbi:MAG TPA: hypothetical protein VFJ82_26460 [Longimicrobium sp.]|nr:hypothetical protein [Longimicrobium sp.]
MRQALRAEVGARSLRHVSRQVGMSPAGLQKFVDGARPHGATRRKLERWYVLHGPGRLPQELTGGSALTILRVLVQDLSPARHRHTMAELVKSLGAAYQAARLPEPAWLVEVRARVERLQHMNGREASP